MKKIFQDFPVFVIFLEGLMVEGGLVMGRQLIATGTGMGIMPGRKRRFCLRVVGCMGRGMIHGVVFVPLSVASLVLAGL